MKYGMCIGDNASRIALVAESGFDYVESCFSLLTEKDDEYFDNFAFELKKNNLKCISVNCFLPGRLKVTGPDVDIDALYEYVEKGFSRGEKIGLEKVVFGSSGARNVPDGWSYEKAFSQMSYFLKSVVVPLAEKYGITVVIEPLSRGDSNIINTACEGVALASTVNSEYVTGLVDFFHMNDVGDTNETVRKLKGSLGHAHIANYLTRAFPNPIDGLDYKSFIEALEYAGCDTCSVEASTDDFDRDCPIALKAIKL